MTTSSPSRLNAESLLTSHQAGSLLQVDPSSICNWVRAGRITAFRTPGGHYRIRAGDLVSFLDQHQMRVPRPLAEVSKRRLLVVDDDENQLRAYSRVFHGYHRQLDTALASNGIDALVEVGRFEPHAMILDVIMPGIDGIEVCQRLKENPVTRSIEIAIASARMTSEVEARAFDAGAKLCLAKPLKVDAVLQQLGVIDVSTTH